MALRLKELTDTCEAEQLFRTHHRIFEPRLGLVFVRVIEFIQIVHFEIRVQGSEILCLLQAIKIIADYFGRKKPPDLPDEVRHLGSEKGILLGCPEEGEELFTDEIVQSAGQTEVVTDVFSRRALLDPDFMELRSRTAHDPVLSYRIRRTEVRPMLRRREISDLLRPERCSLWTWLACRAAVMGRPRRLPFCRACARPARTLSLRISRSNSAKTASSAAIARPAGVVRSNASVSDTKPTPRGSSSCRVASRSVTDLPQRSSRHTTTTSISLRRAASSSSSRRCRCAAPEPTSFTCMAMVQPRRAAYSRMARFCMGSVC